MTIALGCTKTDPRSQEVNLIADDLSSIMIEDRIDLKMKFGLPVMEFPDMDFQLRPTCLVGRAEACSKNF
jgi:hypothetical protein